MALYDSKNKVGHIDKMGQLNFDQEKLSPWIETFFGDDQKRKSCPLGYIMGNY